MAKGGTWKQIKGNLPTRPIPSLVPSTFQLSHDQADYRIGYGEKRGEVGYMPRQRQDEVKLIDSDRWQNNARVLCSDR